MHIHIAGENSLIVYFGEKTDPVVSSQVQQAVAVLQEALHDVLVDLVPSYASLLVIFDPFRCDHLEVRRRIRRSLTDLGGGQAKDGKEQGRIVTLPVYYSVESGPDLEALAKRVGMSVDEVIEMHALGEYRVYAIGFAPGFAYLGEVDERIAAPRLSTPRQKVPRGAVGIADRQTAIYPAVSPGGWNLIGLCPVRMFDPQAEPAMPVAVGDRVRFEPISRQRFLALGGELPEEEGAVA